MQNNFVVLIDGTNVRLATEEEGHTLVNVGTTDEPSRKAHFLEHSEAVKLVEEAVKAYTETEQGKAHIQRLTERFD